MVDIVVSYFFFLLNFLFFLVDSVVEIVVFYFFLGRWRVFLLFFLNFSWILLFKVENVLFFFFFLKSFFYKFPPQTKGRTIERWSKRILNLDSEIKKDKKNLASCISRFRCGNFSNTDIFSHSLTSYICHVCSMLLHLQINASAGFVRGKELRRLLFC